MSMQHRAVEAERPPVSRHLEALARDVVRRWHAGGAQGPIRVADLAEHVRRTGNARYVSVGNAGGRAAIEAALRRYGLTAQIEPLTGNQE
jgi:hypothetical protein